MDKTSYALGMSIAHNMISSGVKDVNFDDFAAGLKAMLNGEEPAVPLQEAGKLLDKYFADLEAKQKEQVAQMSEAFRKEGEEFLAENAKKEGVVVLPSGLQYKVIKEGTGKKPSATSQVKCHYEGTLISGHKFDSSYDRNEPATFGLNQVIAGCKQKAREVGLDYLDILNRNNTWITSIEENYISSSFSTIYGTSVILNLKYEF